MFIILVYTPLSKNRDVLRISSTSCFRTITEKLKGKEIVEPEKYECATVFIGSLVSFTHITDKSKPVEVFIILNSLFFKKKSFCVALFL